MRFTEYVTRFVRLASRYEEETTGTTAFGFPSSPFTDNNGRSKLGSGIAFNDEATCLKELAANAHRIEAWRKTNSYRYLVQVSTLLTSSLFVSFFNYMVCRIMENTKLAVLSKASMFFTSCSE